MRKIGDVACAVAVGINSIETAVGPVLGLRIEKFMQRAACQFAFTIGRHRHQTFVEAIDQKAALLTGGCIEKLFLRPHENRAFEKVPHLVERCVG